MLDKLFQKLFDYIDSLNKKVDDVLTFKFCSCKKKNAKKKDLEQK
jgi:hypothetical protein|tara:strand:- start:176 stop:310 length:135 start_codon:yes stop_codon:yes gene_type:complete